jgi:hypothetical protein
VQLQCLAGILEAAGAKIRYLYAHLPDRCPDESWYKKVITAVSFASQTASLIENNSIEE